MTDDTILANATLVLPDRTQLGWVALADGQIAEIGAGDRVLAGAMDCGGDLVMPGMIELHTDNLERHIEPRPGVNWPHGPALVAHDAELAGVGITTVFDAMRVGSIPDGDGGHLPYARALADELLEMRAQGALRISHFLHLRAEVCSKTLIAEMAEFGPEDRVGIVSLMDHTPGQRQFRDLTKLRQYVSKRGPMDERGFQAHVDGLKAMRAEYGDAHEAAAVAEAARYGSVLASHDDTTPDHVTVSRGYGVDLAEFPTTEVAATACHQAGIAVMMGAPNLIRGGSHSGNVAAHRLAETGYLDILSSDYVPSALLTGALILGDLWGDLARGVATVTAAPATAVGLEDRGRLAPGARADVIRVRRFGTAGAVRAAWSAGTRIA